MSGVTEALDRLERREPEPGDVELVRLILAQYEIRYLQMQRELAECRQCLVSVAEAAGVQCAHL